MRRFIASIAAAFALVNASKAQNFNLDMGAPGSVPSSSFGAAAGQPGSWQQVPNMSPGSPIPLLDISGAPTAVTLSMYQPAFLDLVTTDDPATTGDDEFLLDDYVQGSVGPQYCTFNGLATGIYTVYTYAFAPSSPGTVATVTVLDGGPDTSVQGAWTGSYALGVTHARHTVAVGSAGKLGVIVTTPSGFSPLNGIQLIRDPVDSSSFCDGSVVGSTCLGCGNNGAPGHGCGNAGFPTTGAILEWSGYPGASDATDTLVLRAGGLTGAALFIQAEGLAATPIMFGDGMLCAAVGVRRMELCAQFNGTAISPSQVTSPRIHVAGAVSAGDTRHYQAWYRDANPYCSSSAFNLTNGWTITWRP
jgi:hypothetical protein